MENLKEKLNMLHEKGLLYIFAGSFLTKAISFFGSIFLIRALSKFDYGILSYLDNIYGYVWILAGMGMSNAILRYVVREETLDGKFGRFQYAVKYGFVWNVGLIVLGAVFNLVYPHPAEYKPYSWLLFVLFASLPFQYVSDNVLGNERAMFANKRYALLALAMSFLIIASKVICGNLFGIRGAVISQACVYVCLAILYYSGTRRKHYKNAKSEQVESPERKEINTYAFQYMITNGLWAIFMLNDIYLLGRFCQPEIVADYKVAYTIPGCVALISSSIGIFVAPYFVKNERDTAWVRKTYKTTYAATALLVGAICAFIALLAKPLVLWLYDEQYLSTVPIMRILLLAAFFNCGLRYTTANIMAAMGKIKYNMIVSAIGTALQIIINVIAIPRFGVYGVAYTSCFVYLVMAIILFAVFYVQYYKDPKLEQ